jgi:hypothetical protein
VTNTVLRDRCWCIQQQQHRSVWAMHSLRNLQLHTLTAADLSCDAGWWIRNGYAWFNCCSSLIHSAHLVAARRGCSLVPPTAPHAAHHQQEVCCSAGAREAVRQAAAAVGPPASCLALWQVVLRGAPGTQQLRPLMTQAAHQHGRTQTHTTTS